MASLGISPHVNVKQCSQCQGDTEYHCKTCTKNLCPSCKKTHTLNLDTKYHNVTFYREKFNSCYNLKMCVTHPNQVYEMYCETCDFHVCVLCKQHRHQKLKNIRTVYEDKRKQNEKDLVKIRSDIIYNAHVMLAEIKCDMSTCKKELVFNQLKPILKKSQNLQHAMDTVPNELCVKYKLLLIERAFKQIEKMKRHIRRIHIYEQLFELCAKRPVRFLRFITTAYFPNVQTTPHLTKQVIFALTHNIYVEDLIKLLSQIHIKEKRKRQVENKLLLKHMKHMSSPSLKDSLNVENVDYCGHISCVTPYMVLFNDSHRFFFLDKSRFRFSKVNTYQVFDWPGLKAEDSIRGLHTVNKEGDLIYVHMNNTINKLTIEGKRTLIQNIDYEWEWKSQCVYCSPSSGDLLIGKISLHTLAGKVMRYNDRNQIMHSKIYNDPRFITENNNGDIIVSDWNRAVVVTSREGIYRFSYAGPPSGLPLRPQGICTDAFSHILVCDASTKTVQMINKDSQFLSYLLIRKDFESPRCLSYDMNRHVLWVGSGKTCKLSVYKYIDRHLSLTGKYHYLLIIYHSLSNNISSINALLNYLLR